MQAQRFTAYRSGSVALSRMEGAHSQPWLFIAGSLEA